MLATELQLSFYWRNAVSAKFGEMTGVDYVNHWLCFLEGI